ncbi:hypothetical protein D7X25_31395, partial [bacterium 1XD42-8]
MKLIKVKHTNGSAWSVALEETQTLCEVRSQLIQEKYMSDIDYFIFGETRVSIASESRLKLSDLIENTNAIFIGTSSIIGENIKFSDFIKLTNNEKISYFNQSQLTRGITFTKDGVRRSFHELFSLNAQPLMARNTVNTKMDTSYAFSKVTRDINLMTSHKDSVAFHAPFASAKAEYEHEKEKSYSTSQITEYLLSTYSVSPAGFRIDPLSMEVNMDFYNAIKNVVYSDETDNYIMGRLMEVLNEWGLYVPLIFSMGGVLFTSDEKIITEFSESEKDKKNFSIAAQATFSGYGAGLSILGDDTESSESTTKQEFKNLVVRQIGGVPGNTENNTKFAETLQYMSTWEIVDIESFYPSIMLLRNVKIDGKKTTLLKDVLEIINGNY